MKKAQMLTENISVKVKRGIALSMILILITSCEHFMEKWYYIKVTNLSPKPIMVTAGYERFLMNPYPDTILPDAKPDLYKIEPNKFANLSSSFKWETVIKDMPLDTLSIYFFDADTLEKYNWLLIKSQNRVLKRLDLSIQDLKDKNWEINYP